MADGMNSYLLFFSTGSHFLLPLSCVKRATDMKEREPEMALADFLELLEAGNLLSRAYLIIAGCGDRETGIRAEVVIGLVQVGEEQIYATPEAARSSRNQYMDRITALDTEEEKGKLAFIMVPLLLIPRSVLRRRQNDGAGDRKRWKLYRVCGKKSYQASGDISADTAGAWRA